MMAKGHGLETCKRTGHMNAVIKKGQTIGGSADILARMSRENLLNLWHVANEKLNSINPKEDSESFAFYSVLFDNIVRTYYNDFDSLINKG